MIIRQFFIPGIAHSSYLLGGVSSCMIIDPARDPDIYIHAAEEEGFTITGILMTHLHADFISGHIDLHERTGAPIYAPKSAA
ncbi:MAG: MBL fold metallo-hydrolase, partial [Methanomicrobiales archaeon]|nr:MBL fold metallo-hydrolase [Methanomicrobiales archaeon]